LSHKSTKVRIFPRLGVSNFLCACAIIEFIKRERMEYTVILREAPDGFYIASCPLIPEAHAQGETYEECLANIKEVLQLCLEYRKERGEEIPLEIDAQKVTIAV
jgi:predicted RNase H-like HicB family nuclease